MGEFVSVTLSLQSDLFSELPFVYHFPTMLFVTIVVCSIIVAFIGSYIPARTLLKKRIATALKNM